MKKIITLVLLLLSCTIQAEAWAESDATQLTATCIACHGKQGISGNTLWPNLAGQQVDYLIKEMTAFRDGKRVDPVMSAAFLKGFTDQQVADIAKYYSAFPQANTDSKADTTAGRHVRAYCVSCHGMSGNTVNSLWPNLAGQQAGYLKKQLLDYKAGRRIHPIMQVIANELSDQQIADVAKYYSQQK